MHLHDLKYLIALIVFIASVTQISTSVDSSTSYHLNEVADFDEIVEVDNENDKVNFEEQSAKKPDFEVPVEDVLDPLEINLIEPSSRVKTDVRGVQNKLSSPLVESSRHSAEYKADIGQSVQPKVKLNIFESPLIYEIQSHVPRQGYFIVKERKSVDLPTRTYENSIRDDKGLEGDNQNADNTESDKNCEAESKLPENAFSEKMDQHAEYESNTGPASDKKKPDKFCDKFFDLFNKIPQIMKQLEDSTESQTRGGSWKSIKYIIREQHPNFAKTGILDRPESKNCYQKFVRRRKRHSTYINFRNRKKKFNNNLAKRNVPNDYRFKNIIDFIIKNKSFRDKYTYVPVLFATAKNIDVNRLETSQVTHESTTGSSKLETTSPVNNPTNTSQNNTLLMSSYTPISGLTPPKTSTYTSVLPILKEAKNLTDELSFRIPKLRQSFQDIMDMMKDESTIRRMKKEVPAFTASSNILDANSIQPNQKNDMSSISATIIPMTTAINAVEIPSMTVTNSIVKTETMNPLNPPTVITVISPSKNSESSPNSVNVPFPSESHFNVTIGLDMKSSDKVDKLEFNLPSHRPDIQSIVVNNSISTIESSSDMDFIFPTDGNVIPGVLIYPVDSETSNNKSKRGIEEDDPSSDENKVGIINSYLTIEDPNSSANKKYIDFNPLTKLKKEASNDCQNETEEMLNVLKSLNMRVPDDIDNIKETYTTDLIASTINLTCSSETANTTEMSSENTNYMDLNSFTSLDISNLIEANSNDSTMGNSETTIDVDALCATSFPKVNGINSSSSTATSKTTSDLDNTSSTTVKVKVSGETSPKLHMSTVSQSTSIESKAIKPNEFFGKSSLRRRLAAEKLRKLETDLKLVNEVQNILNGITSHRHEMKKRELPSYQANCSSRNDPVFELNFKVVSSSPDSDRVKQLGKILQWKSEANKCRRRRLSKFERRKKKKRKRKLKPHRKHRFLGQRLQNCS